ncbi:hypothetical protein KKG31_01790 [Patescibacteria group bacterium]|nr:hypothetical protein [Patescibacteria group bacterium]
MIGLLLVGALFFYKYILQYSGNAQRYFLENLDPWTLGMFILYCIAVILMLSLFLKGRYRRIVQII